MRFLALARSVETPRGFLNLGWFLIWAQFLNLGQGFNPLATTSSRPASVADRNVLGKKGHMLKDITL